MAKSVKSCRFLDNWNQKFTTTKIYAYISFINSMVASKYTLCIYITSCNNAVIFTLHSDINNRGLQFNRICSVEQNHFDAFIFFFPDDYSATLPNMSCGATVMVSAANIWQLILIKNIIFVIICIYFIIILNANALINAVLTIILFSEFLGKNRIFQ